MATWMNQMEIEEAVNGCANHPVLGPATRFLNALMESVNEQSDGWPYWKAPSKAASALQELIHANISVWGIPLDNVNITLKDVEVTLKPIKRMAIEQHEEQKQYGNTFNFDVDATWQLARCRCYLAISQRRIIWQLI